MAIDLHIRRLAPATVLLVSGTAHADILTFEGLEHGRIVTDSTFDSVGIEIEAMNFRLPGASPVIFDSRMMGTADPDLQGPLWSGGNLPADTQLGNLIIIPENLRDANGDGIVDDPDDEGRRPAGQLIFEFETDITSFGFDIVDLEGLVSENSSIEYYLNGVLLGTVNFQDFTDPGSDLFDPTLAFGNNSLNRFQPVSADRFDGPEFQGDQPGGAAAFDRVVLNLGGSGAFDNIVYTPVPAPATVGLLGLASLAATRRRR